MTSPPVESARETRMSYVMSRAGPAITAITITIALGFGALGHFGVGLVVEPPDPSMEIADRVTANFLVAEESYLRWGRWVDIATAIAFAGLVLTCSHLAMNPSARTVVVSGAAIAVAADAVDYSKMVAIETGRLALDNDLAADFAAANMARFMLDWTSTLVWIAGLSFVAVGTLTLALGSPRGRWRSVNLILALTLSATVVTDVVGVISSAFPYAFFALGVALVAWSWEARHHPAVIED